MGKNLKWKKRYLIRQSLRKFKHGLRRKEKRKKLRYKDSLIKIKNKRRRKFANNPNSVEHQICKAPNIFSLKDDPLTVISYLNEAKKYFSKRRPVFFDLSGVTSMGPETLTYLCALVTDKTITRNTPLNGNFPKVPKLRAMIKQSGFLDLLHQSGKLHKQGQYIANTLIHRVARTKVESELAGVVSESANLHTFGVKRTRMKSLHPILVECMANTKNHANYGEEKELYNWWLIAYQDQETKITKFCFLDLGVGIFGSLEGMYKDNNLGKWLKSIFVQNNQVATLNGIFQGRTETATNLSERGLGLNHIYNLVKKDSSLKNFTLLTNNIVAHIEYNMNDKIEKINGNFDGTIYYWELIPNYGSK